VPEGEPSLHKLVRAINEGNGAKRRTLLDEGWAPDGTLLDNGEVVVAGRDALDELITAAREDPQFVVRLTAPVESSSGREWARWEVRRCHGEPESRDLVALRSTDGLLQELKMTTADPSASSRKLSKRLEQVVTENPIPAIGLLGGTLYLALRIPVGLFYGDLGVTPDEVGFGPEVLVPQSLTLMVAFVLVVTAIALTGFALRPMVRFVSAAERLKEAGEARRGRIVEALLVGGGIVAFIVGIGLATLLGFPGETGYAFLVGAVVVVGWILAAVFKRIPWMAAEVAELKDQSRRLRERSERWKAVAILLAVYGVMGLLVVLPVWALIDADNVRRGGSAGGRVIPWRALPVELRWSEPKHVKVTNSCKTLRLLGIGNGQMIVFDTRLDRAVRIPVADASASIKRDCPGS
jgi:hypothetical protein